MVARDTVIVYRRHHHAAEMRARYPWAQVIHEDDLDLRNWSAQTWRAQEVAYSDDCSPHVQEALEHLGPAVAMNMRTSQVRAKIWVTHLLRNLPYLASRQHFMAGSYLAGCSLPAFIVGNGPSLEKNRAHMQGAYDCGVVFAVNAATHLVNHHIQVVTESNDIRHKLSRDDVISCFALHSDPRVLAHAENLAPIWCGEIGGIIAGLTGIPSLAVCGSSSATAVDLARRMGFSPIVLVGQDLSYPGGRVYAGQDSAVQQDGERLTFDWRGPSYDRADPLPAYHDAIEVEAYGGGTINTSSTFVPLIRWLESATWKAPYESINATEGGVRVPGWREERLADVVSAMPRRGRMRFMGPEPISGARIAEWLERFRDELDACPEESLLLDGWLCAYTTELLKGWREFPGGRVDEKEKALLGLGLVDQLISEGAAELRTELDSVLATLATKGRQ